ncbi:MMPL family transporter [Lactobacillus paragasseri]|uniref:MMPL family transporter n=1 Tax=Lactobacillus paragasseri TaxID=2107999 RepID=A0A6B2G3F6_9LACO|nr:MMPL family transporter [Lactobacillus paragasseri]MCH5380958.1 MMPL family transporter [Lactobacillus paragasseri]NDJ74270.1 MMPL family transporter [Lactobacillus paragasseri]
MKLLKNHLGALVAWIAILLIAIFSLPDVNALTRQHSEISLPEDVQSSIATNIESKWGHGQDNTYVVGVVFNKKHGKLTSSDKEKIDNTIRFLKDNKKKLGIKSMMTPNDNYATKAQLISKDKTTEIVQLNIANDHSTVSNVNKSLTKAVKTSGIRTYVTGVRILEDDFSASVQEGIKKTELITIFFIFIVLVIVFKSPIVPIISLLTVGVSFITSFSIVTNLVEKFNFPFSNFTQVFMVIVLFGIGTDYNILLYDKFKENLSKGMSNHDATNDALRKAGKTILYSGSSILIGFSALGLAKFSIYQSAVGVAVGVAVLLVVLLTLNPFFMAVLGKKLFWPVKNFEGESNSKLWHALSKGSLAHPIIYLVVMAVVVLPFCLFYSNNLNYNDADEISDSTPSKAGLLLLQDHFSEGTPEYSTLYIQSGHKLDNEKSLKEIDQIVKKIQADPDVKFASSVTEPNGKSIKRLYVDNQLGTVNSGVNTARNGLGTLSNGSKQITNGAVQLQNGANQLSNGTGRLQSGANQLQAGAGRLQTGANQLASGTSRLQTGANALRAGTMQLATGAGSLESGTLNLQQGAVQLENGTIKLVNGAVSLQSGTASLQDGTQALVDGLNTMSAQLSGQMSNANKAQLLELQQGLPKINSGIQKLNQALGKSNSVDTASLRASLTDVGTQAKTIGDNLTQAGNTLKGLQNSGATGLSDSEKAELTQAYAQAMDSAKLNDQQKQAMSAALNQILGKVESASSQKSQALTSSLKSVASNIQAAGEADKKLGQSASSVGATLQNLQGMMSQVATLKQEVNTLATASNKALPGATTALNQLSSGLTQVQSAVAQGAAGASRLNDGASRLNNGAGQLATGLQAGVSGSSQLASGAGQLANGAGQLNTGLQAGLSGTNQLANGIGQLNGGAGQLASGAGQLNGGAGQLASGIGQLNGGASQLANGAGQIASNNPKITAGIDKVNSGLGEGQEYLTGLADSAAGKTFYIPAKMIHSSTFKPALDNYMSSDLKSTKIIIILKLDPASTEGAKKAHELSNMVKKSVKGTSLQSSTIAMGGQSEKIYDTQETASSDFLRTAIIMLVGIGIALIFVTRSVLQPLFILGTLVIAYLTSLSINQWLVHALLGRSLLAWNTPFFSFIMIVALGVDYSIFLMMRYRELGEVNPGWTTSEKMLQACDIIGTVVISAAIILGGTFAALIPSGVPTLIEVALCVDIGLLLLVFLLPINMSAAMKITYEGLGRKKNKKDAE